MRILFVLMSCLVFTILTAQHAPATGFSNTCYTVKLTPAAGILWQYRLRNQSSAVSIRPPAFEIDGRVLTASVENFKIKQEDSLSNGVAVYTATGRLQQD